MQNRIFSEPAAQINHRPLEIMLPLFRRQVGEQVQPRVFGILQIIQSHPQPPDGIIRIDDLPEICHKCPADLLCGIRKAVQSAGSARRSVNIAGVSDLERDGIRNLMPLHHFQNKRIDHFLEHGQRVLKPVVFKQDLSV